MTRCTPETEPGCVETIRAAENTPEDGERVTSERSDLNGSWGRGPPYACDDWTTP